MASGVVAVVLLLVAVGVVLGTRSQLLDTLDRTLLQRSAQLASLAEEGLLERATEEVDDTSWQLVTAEGEVLAASDELLGVEPVLPPLAAGRTASPPRTAEIDTRDDDGEAVRIVARAVERADDGPRGALSLFVLAEVEEVDEALVSMVVAFAVAVPVAVVLLAAAVWWLVGRALAPVDAIRAEVATITGAGLDRRVPVPPTGDEVARLAATMNAMLDRLEQSAATQRRFVGDASHELRTPLTRLRTQLETAGPEDDPSALRARLLAEADEMQDLVEDLLLLARLDEGRDPVRARVDLDDVVLEEVGRVVGTTGVHVDTSAVSGAEVTADRAALARVVRNLLANAVRHAATRVEVALAEHDDGALLTVSDDGPGVAVEHRAQVFERFTRLDDARSRDAGGAGLGLAIVREVVEQHGGEVSVEDASAGGACFVVRLPRRGRTSRGARPDAGDPHDAGHAG